MAPNIEVEGVAPPKVKPEEVVAVAAGALPKMEPVAGAAAPNMEPVAAGAEIKGCDEKEYLDKINLQ